MRRTPADHERMFAFLERAIPPEAAKSSDQFTHYALAKHKPRKLKRLYDQRERMMKALTKEYFVHNKVKMIDGSEPVLS